MRSQASSSRLTFDDLPRDVHLRIIELSSARLVDRVRCCSLVSKRLKALLDEPAFWADVNLDGVEEPCSRHVNGELVLTLARRAAGGLRSLSLRDHPFLFKEVEPDGPCLLAVMASEGLTK